jgi:hypothetical protein
MPIDFFESEVRKAQNRFNETFGTELVCNVNLRQSVILAICFMGNASKKIKAANNKDQVRSLIKKFMKTKNILHNLFDQFEQEIQERRKNQKQKSYQEANKTQVLLSGEKK